MLIAGRQAAGRPGAAQADAIAAARAVRRRRKPRWSAAARRAVAVRMRAYWAKRRAAGTNKK
jgi:hypothetical protein